MTIFLYATFLFAAIANSQTTVEEALVTDMFPPSSSQCQKGESGSTAFTFDFTPSTISKWNSLASKYEQDTFLAEFSHTEPEDTNKTWRIRIGQGGSIYSYVGAFGEAIPPQNHENAPFIDEVWQCVAVNSAKANLPNQKYFIHQSGVYQRDDILLNKPFYSPNLAKYCDEALGECKFVSWGQQAHVPTSHKSSALYYSRYKDCGNGVMEATWAIHNMASGTDVLDYQNVVWSGVRTSVLRDMLHGSNLIEPLPTWANNQVVNMNTLSGYTTFTEDIAPLIAFTLPCGDGRGAVVSCSATNALSVRLFPKTIGAFSEDTARTLSWKKYTLHLKLTTTTNLGTNGCSGCRLNFKNSRTGVQFEINGVLWWAGLSGTTLLCWPAIARAADFNAAYRVGDEILVSYISKPRESNLALSYVYGMDKESSITTNTIGTNAWIPKPARVLWGKAGIDRDFTVFNVNPRVAIKPGKTYSYRQYILSGRLVDADATSSKWVPETVQTMQLQGSTPGRKVNLYSNDNSQFGAILGQYSCSTGVKRCEGSTTPQPGTLPLFYIQCGNGTYLGSDPYYWTPNSTSPSPFLTSGPSTNPTRFPTVTTTSPVSKNPTRLPTSSPLSKNPTRLPTSSPSSRNPTRTPTTSPSPAPSINFGPTMRSYVCRNLADVMTRPVWTLLGYFQPNSCSFLQSAKYSKSYCTSSTLPSLSPSYMPSLTPTDQPTLTRRPSTSIPSTQPSERAIETPTLKPSPLPSSSDPSQNFTESNLLSPSIASSLPPTILSSLSPTIYASLPTDIWSLQPVSPPTSESLSPATSTTQTPTVLSTLSDDTLSPTTPIQPLISKSLSENNQEFVSKQSLVILCIVAVSVTCLGFLWCVFCIRARSNNPSKITLLSK